MKNISLMVYSVQDMENSKVLYSKFLDVDPYVDSPYYIGYKLESQEVGLIPGNEGCVTYIDVSNIKDFLQSLLDSGAVLKQDVTDVGGGLIVAQVLDLDKNILGLREQL